MLDLHPLPVASRADSKEGDAVSVLRIHVRLYLEHEPRKCGLGGTHDTYLAVTRLRGRRPFRESLQNLTNAKIVDRGTEKHGCLTPCKEFGGLERVACS